MKHRHAIEKIVDILKAKYKPQKIILFGSCAWGKVTKDSDIDMLIVKDTKKKYGERWLEIGRLVRHLGISFPFEPFVLTPAEFKKQLRRNLFLQEIARRGSVLYEKN